MNFITTTLSRIKVAHILLYAGVISALGVGVLIFKWDIIGPVLAASLWLGIAFFILLCKKPALGLTVTLIYSFMLPMLGREISSVPFGIGIELLLIVTWLVALFNSNKEDWSCTHNDLVYLMLMWFVVSLLQLANPEGGNVMGWVQEIRGAALHGLLIVPLVFVLYNKKKHLDLFLTIIIGLSVLASFNGIRQLYIGLSPGERTFVEYNAVTHLIWGQLRVFSFYTDAGMFGASQAHVALIALILAFGPFKTWIRLVLATSSLIILYGMLISGTRGSLFVLVFGAFSAILLFKNYKILAIGLVLGVMVLGVLKYTHIGSGNYHIYRLRTALDPEDASLNLRFINQQALAKYMEDKPFGGGLGVIGAWGHEYNSDKFLSTIEPDSYWVKVWAMYGIVGLVIWFCMMMYIIGKCCAYVWLIKDPMLRIKLIALTAGTIGVFVSSYGNEVINRIPASLVVYISFAFVYLGPKLEREAS